MKAIAIHCSAHGRYVVGRTPEALELLLAGKFEESWAIPPVYIDTEQGVEADPAVARAALGITATADRPRTIADATADYWSRQRTKRNAAPAARRDDAPKSVEVEADDNPDDLPPLRRVTSIDADKVFQKWNGRRS